MPTLQDAKHPGYERRNPTNHPGVLIIHVINQGSGPSLDCTLNNNQSQ